ncbi:stressosome-associated protein Prli42 [Terrabacter sp. BE26]
MLMGNKRTQRITVGVIIGVMVLSLALTLLSTATGLL